MRFGCYVMSGCGVSRLGGGILGCCESGLVKCIILGIGRCRFVCWIMAMNGCIFVCNENFCVNSK